MVMVRLESIKSIDVLEALLIEDTSLITQINLEIFKSRNIKNILLKHDELVPYFDLSLLEYKDLYELIKRHPHIHSAVHCSEYTKEQQANLIMLEPRLLDKYVVLKLESVYIIRIIIKHPKLIDKIAELYNLNRLTAYQVMHLITEVPTIKDKIPNLTKKVALDKQIITIEHKIPNSSTYCYYHSDSLYIPKCECLQEIDGGDYGCDRNYCHVFNVDLESNSYHEILRCDACKDKVGVGE